MHQDGTPETWRLGEANISRYDRAKNFSVEMLDELHGDFVREVDTWIEHRSQYAEHLEIRIY